MAQRKPLSKKLRFEVLKRDSFTCQYCGGKAPDILLEIDHIIPVSKDGTDDILNLITSCRDCNSGKSNRQLSDTTVIDKQRHQLEDLQERKEQIEMMFQWQKGLLELDDEVVKQLSDFWSEQVENYSLNENGVKSLKKLRRRFSVGEIMEAMKLSTEQYLAYDENDSPIQETVERAWQKVGGICNTKKLQKDNPEAQRVYYIRGILRNRLNYCNDNMALQLLRQAVELGAGIENLENHAKEVKNWTQWRTAIENFISEQYRKDNIVSEDNKG